MDKKIKKAVFVGTFLTGLAFTVAVNAQNIALTDLENLSNVSGSQQEAVLDKDHWAYKTLQNISKNYGLVDSDGKFEGKGSISRDEAAVILVNLIGQVEQKNLKLTEAEKARIEIVQQEFDEEIKQLFGRVEQLESGIAVLKGRIKNLEDTDRKLWGFAHGEEFSINGGLQGVFYGNFRTGDEPVPSNFSLPYSELAFSGKMNEHLDFMAKIIPTRNFSDTDTNGLLEDVYVGSDIIPNHYLYLGHTAVPFGIEAAMNPLDINFIEFSQISRNIGQGYDTGLLVSGDWDFIKYSGGTYNGTGYNSTDNNRKMTLASQVSLVPFYKNPKLGNLEIGGSHIVGNNTSNNIDGLGGHISYEKGKLGLSGEYMTLNGLKGANIRGHGFYADALYQLTDKLGLSARYDQFNPDRSLENISIAEYTLGSSYLFNDYLMLMLNYTYANRDKGRNSNRLGLMTQVVF